MKTNSAIRQETLALMKGNWGSAVGVAIVLYLIIYAIALVSLLLGMFVGGPIDEPGETILGQVFSLLTTFLLVYPIVFASIKMFLHFVRGEQKLRKVTNSPLRIFKLMFSMMETPSNCLQTSFSSIIFCASIIFSAMVITSSVP